jgi:hypothetical protein
MNATIDQPQADELQALLERDKIRGCIVRLARGEDRRNAELIKASYWPDSTNDYGVFIGNFSEYLAWVIPGSPAIPVTQHVLGQSLIDLTGDVARVETHVTSYHRLKMEAQERDTIVGGRYLDRLHKRQGEWRIAHRVMLYDWYQDFGEAADWSKGVMGLPFRGEHYTGRAHGDYSETFFGKGSAL